MVLSHAPCAWESVRARSARRRPRTIVFGEGARRTHRHDHAPMAKITIDNRVRVECGKAAADELRAEFTYDNPEKAALKRLEGALRGSPNNKRLRGAYFAAQKAPEKITTWAGDGEGRLSFARGSLERVLAIVERHEPYAADDQTTLGDPAVGPIRGAMQLELRPYQERLVETGLERRQGLMRSPTGSGKTVACYALALRVGAPVLVIVWREALLKQWVQRAPRELGIRPDDVGTIGGGKVDRVRPLTIGMQQTLLARGERYAGTFGCVIADEIDRFAAKSLYATADLFRARWRIGVGADERRKDRKEFLIYDQFGDVLVAIDREELGDAVIDVEHRLVPTDFAPQWYVDMPEQARGYAEDRLLDAMIADDARNRLAARLAAEEIKAGQQVLAFAHNRAHVRRLEADVRREVPGLPAAATGAMLGSPADRPEFDRCVDGFHAGALRFAATTYEAGAYGLDLPSVSRGVAVTPIHRNRSKLNQVCGRLCRTSAGTGKKDAVLYSLWDRKLFGLAPLRASLRLAPERTRVLLGGRWVDGREVLRDAKDDELEPAALEQRYAGDDLITAVR